MLRLFWCGLSGELRELIPRDLEVLARLPQSRYARVHRMRARSEALPRSCRVLSRRARGFLSPERSSALLLGLER